MKANGYTLHADDHRIVVATGFSRPSANGKTGPMVQIWILARQQDPLSAARSGRDAVICGGCPLRGDGRGKERACYVDIGKAPLAIWRAWNRGAYPQLPIEALADTFRDRVVRFGAYGDPVFIPFSIVADRVGTAAVRAVRCG
jgi:hypothetical protein